MTMDWMEFVARYDGVGSIIALGLLTWHIVKCEHRSSARWADAKEIREKINNTNDRIAHVEADVSYIKGKIEQFHPEK